MRHTVVSYSGCLTSRLAHPHLLSRRGCCFLYPEMSMGRSGSQQWSPRRTPRRSRSPAHSQSQGSSAGRSPVERHSDFAETLVQASPTKAHVSSAIAKESPLNKQEERKLEVVTQKIKCSICLEIILTVFEVSLQLGFRQPCHKKCFNGKHCFDRLVQKLTASGTASPEEKQRLSSLKQVEPEVWRTCILGLVVQDEGCHRTATQRGSIQTYVLELIAEGRITRKDKCLLLNRRRYVAWHILTDGMTAEAAQQQWEADLKNEEVYRENQRGEMVTRLKSPGNRQPWF